MSCRMAGPSTDECTFCSQHHHQSFQCSRCNTHGCWKTALRCRNCFKLFCQSCIVIVCQRQRYCLGCYTVEKTCNYCHQTRRRYQVRRCINCQNYYCRQHGPWQYTGLCEKCQPKQLCVLF